MAALARLSTVVLAAVAVAGGSATGAAPQRAPCSASQLSPSAAPQKLPAAVASMRSRIVAAAVRCDYAALERLGRERGRGFTFSYGSGSSAAAYWRGLEQSHVDVMAKLVTVLSLRGARGQGGYYVWPAAHRVHPTAADWAELTPLYSRAEVARMRRSGIGYSGWRVGITPQGDWQYFVSGD